MTAAGLEKQHLPRPEGRPILWALLISMGVHGLALLGVVVYASAVFMSTKHQVTAEMKRIEAARTNAPAQETTLTFVEVDPSLAIPEPPKDAKYYSSQSTKAANPDAQKETGAPKIDGTQTHVVQTETAKPSKPFPLQPSPPKAPAPQPEKTEPKPETPAATPTKPGDLAMMTKPPPPAEKPVEKTDAPQIEPHERPHTIAEARQIAGMAMKEDGGVARHRGEVTFDTKGSLMGDYDARMVAAIKQHWYDLLDSHGVSLDRVGRVVVEFRINFDGRITDLNVLESNVGDLQSYLCKSAIMDPAPYDRWPVEMRKLIDAPYREVTFSFYYE